MSKCNKCNKTSPCGCDDKPLFTPAGFVPDSSSSQACGEYIYTGCVVYNGPELVDVNIIPGMNLNQVIQALVVLDLNPNCMTTTCHSPFVNVRIITKTTIDIAWALVPGATTYTVSYANEADSPMSWTILPDAGPTFTHLVIAGLLCGTTYEIKVTANSLAGSCDSLTIRVTTSDC